MKVAVLGDCQNVQLKLADWPVMSRGSEISVVNDHVADTATVVERLRPVDTRTANDCGIAATAALRSPSRGSLPLRSVM
jgi:hypothetical protein